MQLIRHLPARLPDSRPLALTIGNFDGLHLGHQALLNQAVACAPECRPALLCFEPLPRTFFAPDHAVPRIMKLRDKVDVARAMGVEVLAQLRFDRAFSRLSPEQFAREIVAQGLNAGQVVIGPDFRFGHKAAGDADSMRAFGRRFGFETRVVDSVCEDTDSGRRVSSSRLRQALADGDLDQAERLLGRPYAISGRVIRGERLGRKLGFATANLRVAEPPAFSGIAAVRVDGAGLSGHPGIASLGRRPTVDGRDWLLEAHLFDFEGDLYGSHLRVQFEGFIRHEEHFDSLEAMVERMRDDAAQANALLNGRQ
ncbi:MAG: bifunctional riboflavin kinase/FAD synthetase [Wenzhouxiangellaceae bacterium]